MKTIVFIIIGLLFGSRLISQDTLYTTEGHIIAGKVLEITKDDIKYKKASNLDGPVYIISKSEIVMIEYKNGAKDVFEKNNSASNTNPSYSNSTYPSQVYVNPRPAVRVVVGAPPFWWGYRPYVGFRGGYYGGYHGGGYGHYGGWHGGHHR